MLFGGTLSARPNPAKRERRMQSQKKEKKKEKKTFSCKFSVYGASDASTSSYRGGISANFDLSKCVPACIDLKNPFLLRTA